MCWSDIKRKDKKRYPKPFGGTRFYSYLATWKKELDLQKEIRTKDFEAFKRGNRTIINNASNPSTTPSTRDTEELPFVNTQNVSKAERSDADAFALIISLLKDDVTKKFINRFTKLFLTIVEPQAPLWYVTYLEEK